MGKDFRPKGSHFVFCYNEGTPYTPEIGLPDELDPQIDQVAALLHLISTLATNTRKQEKKKIRYAIGFFASKITEYDEEKLRELKPKFVFFDSYYVFGFDFGCYSSNTILPVGIDPHKNPVVALSYLLIQLKLHDNYKSSVRLAIEYFLPEITKWNDQKLKNFLSDLLLPLCEKEYPLITIEKIRKDIRKENLCLYLPKPVTKKNKGGNDNFLQLRDCLFFDLQQFHTVKEYCVWYMAIALNIYMHNSSHKPTTGYGKVQSREEEHRLIYYRSQKNHPHRILHDALTKRSGYDKGFSLLPRNPAFEKTIKNSAAGEQLKILLNRLDARGFRKQGLKASGLFLAYSGARLNNLAVYIQSLDLAFSQNNDHLSKLFKSYPSTILKLDIEETRNKIADIKKNFHKLCKQYKDKPYKENLYSEMFKQRSKNTRYIYEECNKYNFKCLSIKFIEGTSCLYIDLYPKFLDKIRNSKNYKEGLTNVIIGFFGGLLNHYAQIDNLFIYTDRRQSFGFLRPTLTDVGTMRIRLSLGLEPQTYNNIVINSLKALEELLNKFDFTSHQRSKIVTKCFKICEKSKGGNRLLASMRSDGNKWLALRKAQYYLEQNTKDVINKNGRSKDINMSKAFEAYLRHFIVERNIAEVCNEQPQLVQGVDNVATKSTVVFDILHNLVKYSLAFVTNSKIQENDSVLTENFAHSYWHSLLKLYNNCNKASHLLFWLSIASQFKETHFYSKANLLIENILEYLISLNALEQINENLCKRLPDPIAELENTEKAYVATKLNLQGESVEIYFTDSGQQAITASLLAMDMQFIATKDDREKTYDNNVFIFDDSYYELNLFLKEMKTLRTKNKASAKIFFIDVINLSQIKIESIPNAKVVIIDITNNPNLNNEKLKDLITQLHTKKIWVVMVSSAIKHDELGLDKYQSGKIIVLPTKNEKLTKNVEDELKSISKDAMHPYIAAFLQIVNTVYQEKNLFKKEDKKSTSSFVKNEISNNPTKNGDINNFSSKKIKWKKLSKIYPEDTSWYTGDEINKLIHYYLDNKKEDVEILDFLTGNKNQLTDNLREFEKNRRELINNKKQVKDTVVVPLIINLEGKEVDKESEANHWVLLIIKISKDISKPSDVYYFDPKGKGMSLAVKDSLNNDYLYKNFNLVPLQTTTSHVQQDSYNCGPWVIGAAKSLVNNNKLPFQNLNMSEIRKTHKQIINQNTPTTTVNSANSPNAYDFYSNPFVLSNSNLNNKQILETSKENKKEIKKNN